MAEHEQYFIDEKAKKDLKLCMLLTKFLHIHS